MTTSISSRLTLYKVHSGQFAIGRAGVVPDAMDALWGAKGEFALATDLRAGSG